jgi:hypothetical protein
MEEDVMDALVEPPIYNEKENGAELPDYVAGLTLIRLPDSGESGSGDRPGGRTPPRLSPAITNNQW